MNKKKVLITGANGYIGRHLISALINSNKFEVIATDKNNNHVDKRAQYIPYDIFSHAPEAQLYLLFKKPDICIHLAWSDGFNHNALSHLTNLPLHFNFLKQLIDQGVSHLTVAGSFREYGNHEGCASEDLFVPSDNFYCLAKTALRQALSIYVKTREICFQWIRPFTVHGNDECNNSILSKILSWDKEGKKTFPFTDGIEEYDYIHIEMLVEQIVAIVSQQAIQGIINCCSGKPSSLKEKINTFIADHQLTIVPEYGAYPKRSYDSPVIYGDNAKIQRILEGVDDNE